MVRERRHHRRTPATGFPGHLLLDDGYNWGCLLESRNYTAHVRNTALFQAPVLFLVGCAPLIQNSVTRIFMSFWDFRKIDHQVTARPPKGGSWPEYRDKRVLWVRCPSASTAPPLSVFIFSVEVSSVRPQTFLG